MDLGESSNIIINAYEAPGQTSSSESFMAKPKRVLYFSDGVMEQSSSDEECVHQVPKTSPLVDPRTLSWVPWIHHNASKALVWLDYAGESIADFLGITSPKYSYEIAEAQRMKEDEEKEMKAKDIEMAGWVEPGRRMELKNEKRIHTSPESNISVIVRPPVELTQSI